MGRMACNVNVPSIQKGGWGGVETTRMTVSRQNPLLIGYYVCIITLIARGRINRVGLPIVLVVSWTGKMNISLSPFASENLVSRDRFGSPVPRQPALLHTQTESGAYLRNFSRVPRRRPFII